MQATIYHNPRCSKSRQTLALLAALGCDITVIEYLKDVPSITQIEKLLQQLAFDSPRKLIRSKEACYTALGLADASITDKLLLKAMHENPILIERPIVVIANKAVLGRPPDNVNALLTGNFGG